MGVLDKIFGKKQEVQPPTIPVSEAPVVPTMPAPEDIPTSAPQVGEIMSETIAKPLEPQLIMPEPEISPIVEERKIEEAVPKDIFVKLDSFGDVLSEMTIIRSSLLNLKSLALMQGEMQDLGNDINNLVKAYSEDVETSLSNLERIIEGVSGAAKKAKQVKYKAAKPQKSKAVEDLESRIKKLRTEIEGVGKKK
jgi:hypothetical protein